MTRRAARRQLGAHPPIGARTRLSRITQFFDRFRAQTADLPSEAEAEKIIREDDPALADAIAANGNAHHTKGVTLGMGVIPGTSFQFFSPDGTRTILRPEDFAWEGSRVTRDSAYTAAALAYVALRYRANKVAEAPPQVMERDPKDGTLDWLPRHPLEALLDDPAPDYSMGELMKRTQLYVDITGSALWLKEEDQLGRMGRLTPYSGDQFQSESKGNRIYGSFKLQTEKGDRDVAPENVVLFRDVNPGGWHEGVSLVDTMLAWLNLGERTSSAIRSVLRNALIPSVVITADKDWQPDDEAYEKWKNAVEAYALPQNKGKPLAMLGGGRAQVIPVSVGNLLPVELYDRIESVVAAVSGIPAVVLSFLVGLKNSPWSQMAEARRMAYEDTIQPLWTAHAEAMTRQLLWAPFRKGQPVEANHRRVVRFDTSEIPALQPDRKVQSEILRNVDAAKVASGNELRAIVGLELSDDPAYDELPDRNAPPPMIPGQTPPGQDPAAEDAPPKPPQKPKLTVAKMREVLAEARKLEEQAERDVRWKIRDAQTGGHEIAWLLLAAGQLEADKATVLRLARATFDEGKAEGEPPASEAAVRALMTRIERADLERSWKKKLPPLVRATAEQAVNLTATEIGVSFHVLQPGLKDYTQAHAAELVQGIVGTTRDAVKDALEAGLAEGESVPQLMARLQDSGAFAKSRAELIARTETTTVTNGASRAALERWQKDSGATVEKSWLSARDSRVREEHADLDDGSWLDIDEEFANGLTEPGEPNCRCTLIYRVKE